jgi:hypothetical protein
LVEKVAIPNVEQTDPRYAAKTKEGKSPKNDWELMLIVGASVGALLNAMLSGDRIMEAVPGL